MNLWLKKRFEVKQDGTIVVRAGTQSNCAGIASIRVRITLIPGAGINFSLLDQGNSEELDDVVLTGTAIPEVYKTAVFKGAQKAYEALGLSEGVQFTLINALVHPVDARETKFIEVGETALTGWIKYTHDI